MPSMKYFWKAINRMKIGMMENREPTISRL